MIESSLSRQSASDVVSRHGLPCCDMVLRPGARQVPSACGSAHDRLSAHATKGYGLFLSTLHGYYSQILKKRTLGIWGNTLCAASATPRHLGS